MTDRSPFTTTGLSQFVFRVVVAIDGSRVTMLVASERFDKAGDWAVAHHRYMVGCSTPTPHITLVSVENLGGLYQ